MIEIITIGDEILIGQIVDTNSAWMSAELNKAGFQISQITSIHDNEAHILNALEQALTKNDIVLITGGLGPTKDDITKNTLCKFFETELIFSESVFQNIQNLFAHRPSVLNKLTQTQALVPKNCEVIQNSVGTAPIMWFERNGKVVVSMPGVPFEMKEVMKLEIIPRLTRKFSNQYVVNQTVQVIGYGESALAIKIADWENNLPEYLHLAYLPSFGIVKLRLSGASDNKNLLEKAVNEQFDNLTEILGENIIAKDDMPIEYSLFNLLKQNRLTLAAAESCTGGNIAHRITLIPGVSEVFRGSVVAYSDEVKKNVLHVSLEHLSRFGAVSQPVVEQMAANICKLLNADVGISVSGIAGPTGGSEEKPVGTVWIGMSICGKISTKLFHFGNFPREVIIERTTTAAITMLMEEIKRTGNC